MEILTRGRWRLLTLATLSVLLGGAVLIRQGMHYRMPLDPALTAADLRSREERLIQGFTSPGDRAWARSRQRDARSLPLEAKARHLQRRILDEERARPSLLLPLKYSPQKPVRTGEVETTSQFLAALAFQYGVTRDSHVAQLARLVVADLVRMDQANGLDGYLPKEVIVSGGRMDVLLDETHANVYTQLLFAYTCAFMLIDDADLRASIRAHTELVTGRLVDGGLVVRNGAGERQPFGDLSPRRFRLDRGRALEGLMICEAGVAILKGDEAYRSRVLSLQRQRQVLLENYGYDRQIQLLAFKLGPWYLPSTSSTWLNFQKLITLLLSRARSPYVEALARLWASQRGELNVLHSTMALTWVRDMPPAERTQLEGLIEYYLETFPLTPVARHVAVGGSQALRLRDGTRYFKNNSQQEADLPLPVFMRPRQPHEWKRLQGRTGQEEAVGGQITPEQAPEVDYLLAYWMYRAYKNGRLPPS